MIEVQDIVSGYGQLRVLKSVSITVNRGELVTVVGANGAGKSTLLRCIQRLGPVWSGRVIFDGSDITQASVERVVRMGLTLVPQSRELFPLMSVADNLLLGGYLHRSEKDAVRNRKRDLDSVYQLFPALLERHMAPAGALSGGEQQMLAIGRALMSRPRALMLDEPSLGLAPLVVRQIFAAIADLRRQSLAILLVEQNVKAALKLAERAYMLETGRVAASGPARELASDPAIMKAYLGAGARSMPSAQAS
jgi:branched-chain amino acid transport system ATP-binding protein